MDFIKPVYSTEKVDQVNIGIISNFLGLLPLLGQDLQRRHSKIVCNSELFPLAGL